ncbi:MAG: polyphosphate kinase 1 [Chitinophagaceae bacterium]|nr:polyphosphate kinase 1 [Chitinophagaceae bacterium]MBN8667895.1 polyphosphate kinase 1 [Chitinophagales bacterium]
MSEQKAKTIYRDISWLSFNARVLQEAGDPSVPLRERIRFLGIFSNNLDEFFRVRVATIRRMIQFGTRLKNMYLESNPQHILDQIQGIVLDQQREFDRIWEDIVEQLRDQKIYLVTERQLNKDQKDFVRRYYDEEVSSNVIPLMIQSIPSFPYLREKSIYLGVVMWKRDSALKKKYALIEVPSRVFGRFIQLPSPNPDEHHIILLEDVIRFNLPVIFSYFGYDRYSSHVFKITKDAEIDIDNDISTSLIQKLEKGLKNRRKGKPVRFVYDKQMDPGLLEFLISKLNLARKDSIIPGGRIHNFRHFMDFPDNVFQVKRQRRKPFPHPALRNGKRITETVLEGDLMLHFPYHSFNPVIDLLRESAIDPDVTAIKVTAYRLAPNSKVVNALINAVRNGKQVTVMLELRARFDEEANLAWKELLEEEGVKVLIGIPNLKVHAKLCLIKKRVKNKTIQYGFVSTGNLNERTAKVYGDHCLMTSNRRVMADINRIFAFLEKPKKGLAILKNCSMIIPSPGIVRKEIEKLIQFEIKQAKMGKPASIILKMNSLSDEGLISKLNEAAREGVQIRMVIRGICCMLTENPKFKAPVHAVSIVDEYLEHARVWVFHNAGNEKVYLSSADWMVRNIDHRIEATCPVLSPEIQQELKDILDIQFSGNVKARILNNSLSNEYVRTGKRRIRAQIEIYNYLYKKTLTSLETGSH